MGYRRCGGPAVARRRRWVAHHVMPVRLETLFRPAALGGAELWIRVYPDDIHIDGHETALTDAERAAGERVLERGGRTRCRRGRPRRCVGHRGGGGRAGPRAVGRRTPATRWCRRRRPRHHLDRAPLTRLMPHHFTFSAYREGRLMWRADGAPVPDELPAGFAPPEINQDDPPTSRRGRCRGSPPADGWSISTKR